MRIYTRTGDGGQTGLRGGMRVPKDHPRIEACGAVDELNCLLGLALAETVPDQLRRILGRVQAALFEVGADLACPDPSGEARSPIDQTNVSSLEADIDACQQAVAPLDRFVVPGGSRAGATLHLARAVCRRAERRIVAMGATAGDQAPKHLIRYLNRLADLLFVLARTANAEAGVPEPTWPPPPRSLQ